MMRKMIGAVACTLAISCAAPSDEDLEMMADISEKQQEIIGGSTPSTSVWRYVATVYDESTDDRCTGTIIGPRHVLTAAHCAIGEGSKVGFYSSASAPKSYASNVLVEKVYLPEGVSSSGSHTDLDGKFADYRVLFLTKVVPTDSRVAPIAWGYPGNDVGMWVVGSGQHDGAGALGLPRNDNAYLKARFVETYSGDDDNGKIWLKDDYTSSGDSGGPLLKWDDYLSSYVVYAALSGTDWKDGKDRSKYTSASLHRLSLLDAVGIDLVANVEYSGAAVRSTSNVSWDQCASMCKANQSCAAFSWDPGPVFVMGMCTEKSSKGSNNSESGSVSGYKRSTGTGPCVTAVGDSTNGACRI